MILKNLTLKNFRKFKNATIEFPDGVTGVVGLNGVGKSTIFEAIAWVLYGPVAARTSADEIKRQGTLTSDTCRVEIEFVFEDKNYRIFREMKGKNQTTSATAAVDGKIAATSAESVTTFVQKKLGMDFKSFFTSIFAKQKELNALSTMIASERRPLILRMLGIDSLDDVVKEVKSDKRDKDALLEKLSQDLVDEKGKDRIDFFKDVIRNLEKQKNENEVLIKKSKEKTQNLKKDLDTLEKKCKIAKGEYEKIKDKKENLSNRKTLFENKEKLSVEIKKLKNKISERKKIIDQQKKKLIRFAKLDSDIKSSEKRLDEISKKIEELVKIIEQKKTLLSRLKEDIKDIESKKKKIEEIGPDAKCPTCERVLADQYKNLLKRLDKDLTKKDKEIVTFSREIKIFNEDKEKVTREEQAFNKKKNYLLTQLREKERIDTTIKNIEGEVDKEKIDLTNKEKKFREISAVKFDIKEFETVSKQVDNFYKIYQNALDLRDNKKDVFNSLKLELERKESDKKLILQKIGNFKEKISELEEYKKVIGEEILMIHKRVRTVLVKSGPVTGLYRTRGFEVIAGLKKTDTKYKEHGCVYYLDLAKVYFSPRLSHEHNRVASQVKEDETIIDMFAGVGPFSILIAK